MKYSKDISDKICQYVKEGNGKAVSAKKAGITYETLRYWCKAKPVFSVELKKAEEEFLDTVETRCFATVLLASVPKTWQAAAWVLERRFPDKYSNSYKFAAQMLKENEELEKEIIELVKDYVPKEKRKELIAAFEKRAKMGEAVRSIAESRKQ